jgi:hypothetical protein
MTTRESAQQNPKKQPNQQQQQQNPQKQPNQQNDHQQEYPHKQQK